MLVRKNKNAIMIKSSLHSIDSAAPECVREMSKLQIRRQKSRHQDHLFLYRKYVYSFFAINNALYNSCNKNNLIINERSFFIDGQIICHAIFSKKPIIFCKKAVGYFLMRDESESKANDDDDIENYYSMIQKLALNDGYKYSKQITLLPKCEDFYKKIICAYNDGNFIEARRSFKELLKFKSIYRIPTFIAFRDGNAFIWWMKLFFYPFVVIKKNRCKH